MTIGNFKVGGTAKLAEGAQFSPYEAFSVGPAITAIGQVDISNPDKRIRQEVSFLIELLPQKGGGYVVNVPALPSGSTQGRNLSEALENVRDNLEGLVEDLAKGELTYERTPEFLGLREQRMVVRVPHP
jgi:predicted RNase H-like HicB family nuclease